MNHILLYMQKMKDYIFIIKNANNYLKEIAIMAFEIGCLQGSKLKEYALNYFDNVIVEQDLSGKDRFLFIIK